MIEYQIISTGSKGNAVVISNSILIDCGVPFKALKDVYGSLDLVLLTHIHGDHFNRQTVKKLAQERPMLRFGCCEWLVALLVECEVDKRDIDVYKPGEEYIYGRFAVKPFSLVHNVSNCGYKIYMGDYFNPDRLIYATDTNSMTGVEAKDYDLYMIEANYSEKEITERIKHKQEAGEYCHEWDVLNNHLSKEKADNWLYQNMSANSEYIYLHEHTDRKGVGDGTTN